MSGPAIAFCLFAWDMIKNVGLNSCVFLKLCSMFNAFMIFDGDPGADFDFPANKQKAIAGPLTLQHMVDIVLFLDIEKDNSRTLTTLKNRFGPAGIKTTLNLPPY